ncbi:hypothetical protein KSC_019560 [Ktedonobacter sp. SOSP1-52]|uniref:hypothetical protein n=1 Tax=Ktedonobacter sp. SOSP1-52 TaxID=2778366 RepID=UPI0019152FE7|nr:hypothetical protein [Ktedonobacter sp. SOSP1-52]GHO63064.1 hypothetical protein KSC_019560 [Ktedonobacter sp. SOSP1-52]
MHFQQTHPIVRATVLSTYTHTYTSTTYDSSTNTSTSQTETETCADTIQFLANGQNLKVNVRPLLACGVETGDRPRIAYDPQHPTHLQFVPSGGPFWGNMLGVIIAFAVIGTALPFALMLVIPLIEGWKFWPRGTKAFLHEHEAISWWMFGISFLVLILCFILQIAFGAVFS